jgi:hypothetical protein
MTKLKKWKEVSPYTGAPVKEDAPVNMASGGGIDMNPNGMKKKKELDARTKSYKTHRSKLEANRLARIARAENRRKYGFVETIKNKIKEYAPAGLGKTQPVADMRSDVPKKIKKNAKDK